MDDREMLENAVESGHSWNSSTLGSLHRSIFLVSLPFGILQFMLPIYGMEIEAKAVEIGLFYSVFSLISVALRPLIGGWIDRFGKKRFVIVGITGYFFAMLVLAVSEQAWMVLVARFLQGLGSAFLWISVWTITAEDSGNTHRARAFGVIFETSTKGSILGTFIGFSLLIPLGIDSGWHPLFLGYAIAALVALGWTTRSLPRDRPMKRLQPAPPIRWTRALGLLLMVAAITGAAWAMLEPVMMIFLQEQITEEVNLLALAALPSGLVWALLPSRLGSLADRYGRKRMMVLGIAVASLTSFIIPELRSLAALAVLWACQAVCFAAGDPAEQALVSNLTGQEQRGRAFGLYDAAVGVGSIVGPLMGSWLYQFVDAPAPFYVNGIMLAICGIIIWIFFQEPEQHVAAFQAAAMD